MSLATGGIHCTICQHLSGATEDCSIVRGRNLRTLCRQKCCMYVCMYCVELTVDRWRVRFASLALSGQTVSVTKQYNLSTVLAKSGGDAPWLES